jgi:Ca2+-binding EF-hand superfamily protein
MNSLAPKIIPVGIASIICGIALAGGDRGDHMKMMDTDGDGKITSAEHATASKTMFTKMDANQDGRVTAVEMDAAHASMTEGKSKDHQNKDPMARHTDGHDKENAADKSYDKAGDKDGQISSARMRSGNHQIAAIDSNGDGELTSAEHASGMKKMFSKMDANGDGTLTAQEMREGRTDMSASDQ